MAKKKSQSESNPSMQCSVCGHWMRLHGQDEQGTYIQRFYPCCGEHGEFEHEKDVCEACCKTRCPYRFKDMLVIFYEADISGGVLEKWMWTATLNGELQDYHKKSVLIKRAEEKGVPWVVIKIVPNGYPKVIQQSKK